MRVVVDTNVRIAAILTRGTTRECLELLGASHDEVITSRELRSEFDEVVRRKGLPRKAEELPFFSPWQAREKLVEAAVTFERTCRDADDDYVLACAVAGDADVILTGDLDLLTLDPFRDIRIFTPRQFLTHFYPHHLVT